MNKLVKGAVAGAAGLALLMGGAGTLAYWNDSADIADASVVAGELTVTASNGTWTGNPALVVPGDVITYTSNVTIVAKGTNLKSTFSIDPTTIATSATGTAAKNTELRNALLNSTVLSLGTATGGTLTSNGAGSNSFEVAPTGVNGGTITVPVTVTVTFPASTADKVAQTGSVNLNNLGFKLVQHV